MRSSAVKMSIFRRVPTAKSKGKSNPDRHISWALLSWLLPLCPLRLTFDLMPSREWKLARRSLPYGERTLVMGVLNVTPDSFSDGGEFFSLNPADAHAQHILTQGPHI